MHYSWLGFAYEATAWLGQLLAEKLFDLVLALLGTLFGYWLAKRHIEHFVSSVVKKLDDKYLDLNRQIAFRKAVAAMLPELPRFYLRPTSAFSSSVASAVGEFTSWSTAVDPAHTPEKSLKLVGEEAYTLAAGLTEKDLGFREASPNPNYEWQVEIVRLPLGWTVEEAAHLTIYNWETGAAAYRHAVMKETARTANSIRYSWIWDTQAVACGFYVGAVDFTIGGTAKLQKTASSVGEPLRIFLKIENGQVIKTHENVPWNDKAIAT